MLKIYNVNHYVSIDGTEWREVGDTEYCVSDEDLNEKISFENLSFEGACEYLSKHLTGGLWIANPLFCRKPIIRIYPSGSWESISYKEFNTLSYKLKYTEWTGVTLEWIIKHLSVDQCIQYLKERGMMEDCVKKMVKEKIEDTAEAYVEESLKKVVDDEIKAYMQKDITVGGGWSEPERKLSRNEYLAECTAKVIDEKLNPEKVADIVRNYYQRTIDDNVERIKVAVNTGIKTQFDETTRKALSDNVVSMLMAGDTYKRLSDSMERILK